MKVYFIVFVSDGRFPEQSEYPKGYSSHIDNARPHGSEAEAVRKRDRCFSFGHPWHGCYHIIETQWDMETGEIS